MAVSIPWGKVQITPGKCRSWSEIRRLYRIDEFATLKANVEQTKSIFDNLPMSTPPLASYLRSHRLRSGMSQRELADLVGIVTHQQVSQHERSTLIPSLMAALGYQIVFGVPMTELFPGLLEGIQTNVEERLHRMKEKLEAYTVKGRGAQRIARRLEWFWERENPESISSQA